MIEYEFSVKIYGKKLTKRNVTLIRECFSGRLDHIQFLEDYVFAKFTDLKREAGEALIRHTTDLLSSNLETPIRMTADIRSIKTAKIGDVAFETGDTDKPFLVRVKKTELQVVRVMAKSSAAALTDAIHGKGKVVNARRKGPEVKIVDFVADIEVE